MSTRNSTSSKAKTKKPSMIPITVLREWWNNIQVDNVDNNNANTEEDNRELRRRLLSIKVNQTLRTTQLLVDFDATGQPVLKLRPPPELVKFPPIPRPRWPSECEVISDVIHHIEWDPPEPEPFYQFTGHERTPMPVGEERGKLVYCVDHATKYPYFTSSCVGGRKGPIKSGTHEINQTEFTLQFESRFESGNLQKAVQVGVYNYELTLRTDMYTSKHTQWFYFRVRNMTAGVTYRFTIINMMKSSSLYCQGMKPLLYSERDAAEKGVGWQRTGSNISYYRNCNQNTEDSKGDTITLYSFTWTVQFPHDSDTCYLAHCYPYTYSHLQNFLKRISSNPAVMSYCTLRVLCNSLAGNAVYVLSVTSRELNRTKKAVVVTARVHPGETNGSWMMEGFLEFLLGNSEHAQLLRDTFVFKVVPMLNPDGVIVGNYRCSLAGQDLNRKYKTLLKDLFPSVWHTRNMVERLVADMDVALYCDFHGHNRKNNVFMYGCSNEDSASLTFPERVFPLMMSRNICDKFSFRSCKFRVQKSKEGTGRIAMWRLGIKNSYTMEASFGGSTLGDRTGTHFTTQDLKSIGFFFCDTLLDYCDPDATKMSCCLTELAKMVRKQVSEKLGKDLSIDCPFSVSGLESSTSGSNSSDSDGLPVHLLNQLQNGHQQQTPVKKKKKKSRKERSRLRPERPKTNVLQGSIKNIELILPRKSPVHIQERPVRKHRKQVNGLIRKAEVPPPTTHPEKVSQVTLCQGCKPVKDDHVEKTKPSDHCHKANVCLHLSSYTAPHTHGGEPGMAASQRRPPTQTLHIRTLLPLLPSHTYPGEEQRPCSQQPTFHYGFCRGLPRTLTAAHRSSSAMRFKTIPDIIPKKRWLSDGPEAFGRHSFTKKYPLQAFTNHHFVPEDSSVSHTGTTKTERQHVEQEEHSSEAALSLLRCTQFREQQWRDFCPDFALRQTESRGSSFLPALRGTDPREKQLRKETQGDIALLSRVKAFRPHERGTSKSTERPPRWSSA